MAVSVIETEYDGYRFRSRLEARWAVFFNAAQIDYQYETEGFKLPWCLERRSDTFNYLPDFWLPELGMWAEVKGRWNDAQRWRFMNAAAALGMERRGSILLLGDTFRQPRKGSTRPWCFAWRSNLNVLTAKEWPSVPNWEDEFAAEIGEGVSGTTPDWLRGRTSPFPGPGWFVAASKQAQQARFEFGETPGRGGV